MRPASAPELPPVALRNVDELVIPAEALPLVTRDDGGKVRPLRIDQDGRQLGTFKVKHEQNWSE